jgi:hypothetical protein
MSPVKYELGFISYKTAFFIAEGQTGNAWEPSKPMINSFPPHPKCHSLPPTSLSLHSLHSHRREKPQILHSIIWLGSVAET